MKILQTTSIIAALGLAGVISSAAHAGTSPTTFKQVGKYKVSHCYAELIHEKNKKLETYKDIKKYGYNFCTQKAERLIDSGLAKLKSPNFANNIKLLRIETGALPGTEESSVTYLAVDKNNNVAVLPLTHLSVVEVEPDYYEPNIYREGINLKFTKNSNKLCTLKDLGLANHYLGESLLNHGGKDACVALKFNKKNQPYWHWEPTDKWNPI